MNYVLFDLDHHCRECIFEKYENQFSLSSWLTVRSILIATSIKHTSFCLKDGRIIVLSRWIFPPISTKNVCIAGITFPFKCVSSITGCSIRGKIFKLSIYCFQQNWTKILRIKLLMHCTTQQTDIYIYVCMYVCMYINKIRKIRFWNTLIFIQN